MPEKPSTPKNIGEGLKGPQRQFWKEYLFVQYDKKNVSLLSACIIIKSLSEGTKVFRSLIDPSIKEGDYFGVWDCFHTTVQMVVLRSKVLVFINPTVQWHMLNTSESILLLRLCIYSLPGFWISVMHSRIKNIPIHEIFCAIPPPYYLYWIESSYPNVNLNQYYGPLCLQCMYEIQGTKSDIWQCNTLLDAVVTILKYKENVTYYSIYINCVSDGTVYYLTVSTDDIVDTTNNQ